MRVGISSDKARYWNRDTSSNVGVICENPQNLPVRMNVSKARIRALGMVHENSASSNYPLMALSSPLDSKHGEIWCPDSSVFKDFRYLRN